MRNKMDEFDKKLRENIHPAQIELSQEQLDELYRNIAHNKRRRFGKNRKFALISLCLCISIFSIAIAVYAFFHDNSQQNPPAYLDFGQFELLDIDEETVSQYLPDSVIQVFRDCQFEQARLYTHESAPMAIEVVYSEITDPIPVPSIVNLFVQLKDNFTYKYDDDYVRNAVIKTINTVEVLSTDIAPENELPQQYRKFVWQNFIFYLRADSLYDNFADTLITDILR